MCLKIIKKSLRRAISKSATFWYRRLFPAESLDYRTFWEASPDRRVDANEFLFKALNGEKPFLAARFGSTELEIAHQWRRSMSSNSSGLARLLEAFATGDPHFVYVRSKYRIERLGINPLGKPERERFGQLMGASMRSIDLLGSWVPGEVMFAPFLEGAVFDRRKNLEPYRHQEPWSQALSGRKVLVVHPFASSIARQFRDSRENLFPNKAVLPDFDLLTLVPPRAHHGEISGADGWFSALEELLARVLAMDFDVGIVGAGPFGLPLAAGMKAQGKKVVHLGGATQLLFGIMGSRWDSDVLISALRNEYWTRPSPSETPPLQARRLSDHSYW